MRFVVSDDCTFHVAHLAAALVYGLDLVILIDRGCADASGTRWASGCGAAPPGLSVSKLTLTCRTYLTAHTTCAIWTYLLRPIALQKSSAGVELKAGRAWHWRDEAQSPRASIPSFECSSARVQPPIGTELASHSSSLFFSRSASMLAAIRSPTCQHGCPHGGCQRRSLAAEWSPGRAR